MSISAISRKHQINAVTLYAWKKMLMGPGKDKKSSEKQAEKEKLRREVEALKKFISDLAIGNSILKEANDILNKKQTTPAWFRSPKK